VPKTPLDDAAQLAALVNSSDAAIYGENVDGILTFWNHAAEEMFGYTAREALGQSIYLIVPDDRRQEEADIQRRIHEGERVPHYETIRRTKHGRLIDVSVVASPITLPGGAIVGVSKVARDITEQRAVEAKLSLKSALIDLSDEAIFAWDLEHGIVEWNTGSERLYGYPRGEAIGRISHELLGTIHPGSVDAVLERLSSHREWSGEVRHHTRDGRQLIIESRQQLIRAGGRSLVLETNRDVTARRQAEIALARLAAIVESSDDAIIAMDLEGTITAWNQAAERMYGYAAGEAQGRSIRLVVPEARQDEESTVLDRIARGEHVKHFETVRRRKDGSHFPVSLSISPIRDERDRVIGASKIARDVSERHRASQHAALLAEVGAVLVGSFEYQSTLKTLANLAVPAVADLCAVDILTEARTLERVAVAHVDPAKIDIARILQSRYEDPNSPYGPASVIRTGTPAMVKEITDDMIVASGRGDDERIRLVRSLGLRSYMIVPLTAHGRTFGALTMATAESGRTYTDDDYRFAQDVAFRAALAVDNARAYEEAQTANRLKDEFLATLSHELRTPLNAILGYSRLIQSGMMTAGKQAHALQTVERNATSLTQIVGDILDVSRIISGKIRLNVQPVDLPRVVSDAVETVLPAADAKLIRVQMILDPRAAPISGDPDRLQQVVWNLVSNAVKFTPKEGVVQVRLERVNSHVEIVVSDNGIGIAPDFIPHMFERFRQGDSGTTREHGGIGLGLAIVRHLVELHGGTIQAASDGRNTGSTFRVQLPLMIVHQETPVERRVHPTTEAVAMDRELPDLTGLVVLAVDDDADARALVCETLEMRGARVTAVESAAEALEALARTRPDVMIADIGMSRSDGFKLIKRVRQSADAAIRDVPAAALTAYARAEDRKKALQAGFHMHLAKPVDPAELVIAVAALAKRTSRQNT
jgi:PAS domain S-box-containing protein